MSYEPQVQTASDGDRWMSNHLLFATEQEAKWYVEDLRDRWTAVGKTRVVESDLPPTHQIIDHVLVPIPPTGAAGADAGPPPPAPGGATGATGGTGATGATGRAGTI